MNRVPLKPGRRAARRFVATLGVVFLLSIISTVLFVGPDAFENHTSVARTVTGAVVGVLALGVAAEGWRGYLRWPPDASTRALFPPGQLASARIGGVILTAFAVSPMFLGITLLMERRGR